MKKQRIVVDMPLLPSERNGKTALWETKKVQAIIAKRKKKAVAKKKKNLLNPSKLKIVHFGNISYSKYLQTKYWKSIKVIILKKYKYRCQNCGSTSTLQVHHLNYPPRGTEHTQLDCLTLLCGSCHREVHGIDDLHAPWGGLIAQK